MEGRDYIKEYFKESLNGFEAEVRPDLWTNISSQINATTGPSVAGVKSASFAKIAMVISAACIAVAGLIYLAKTDKPEDNNTVKKTEKEQVKTDLKQLEPTKPTKMVVESIEGGLNYLQNEEIVEDINYITNDISSIEDNNIEQQPATTTINPEFDSPVLPINKEEKTAGNSIDFTKENTQSIAQENRKEETNESYSIGVLSNIFTPNNDGANDYFSIESVGLKDFSLVIIDQNNKTVFQTNDVSFRWDGVALSGDPVAEGNYIYYLTARDSSGKLITKANKLTIKR